VTRIVLAGELDMAVAPALQAELTQALERSSSVILDFRGVEFVDSTGIHALAAADASARAANKRLVIADPSPKVVRVLELTSMDQVLEIEALAAPERRT
jgi:anti-anti-sigma factor